MKKNKLNNILMIILLAISLFSILNGLNNYGILLHNVDLSYNVIRMVDDFNLKINLAVNEGEGFHYINSSNIEDYYDVGKKITLVDIYVSSLNRLRIIPLQLILSSIIFGFTLNYFVKWK